MSESKRRAIPAVEKVVSKLGPLELPRPLVVALVRHELQKLRETNAIPPVEEIIGIISAQLGKLSRSRLQPVINGTGIVIHTNLGRAPLAAEAEEALKRVARNYTNLEFDLETGERGGRAPYLESALALLCGAEGALVVNNCAAALVLAARFFCDRKKEIVISRGELIQIGGGFRVPEMLEASGARLREVGATNKTTLADYEKALSSETALILKVHRSNFFMEGFVDSPSREQLARLAQSRAIPFMEDLGSGAVTPTEALGLTEHEPTVSEVLRSGVDLVSFSGDKLLGGPQAGILAGRAELMDGLKQAPFFRALRCDKLILAGLEATVDLHLRDARGSDGVPILKMIRQPEQELRRRAEVLVRALKSSDLEAEIGSGKGEIGGGTLPKSVLPSVTVDLVPPAPFDLFAARLRQNVPPVIGYVSGGKFKVDLRTVLPEQDEPLLNALIQAARLAQ